MSLLPRLATSFAALLIGLRFFSSTALAVQNPEAFYDWGPYYNQTERKVLGIAVLAETDEATPAATPTEQAEEVKVDPKDIQRYHGYFLFGGLAPDNPFYFLKTSQEGVRSAFTFNSEAKDKLKIEFAGERMAEIQGLVDRGKTGSLKGPIQNYENNLESVAKDLEKLKEDGKDVGSLLTHVQTETAKHNLVLEEVSVKLPDAADSLEKAQFASENIGDRIADLQGLPSLPPDVLSRLQALKAQGLLTPEEVNKIVAIKTRAEVRDELRKLSEQGVMPEADLYKLNENVKVIFPDQFNRVVEMQKLEEFRRLETQRPDEETLKKMQDFAKDYKPGDIIPPDIKKYWGPTVRLQEIQSTFRPDFIDETIIQNNKDLYQKYQEVVARSKPSDNEFKRAQELMGQYNREGKAVPPEVQRVLEFGYKFGTGTNPANVPPQYIPSSFFTNTQPKACSAGKYWSFNSGESGGGHCEAIPNFEQYSTQYNEAFKNAPNQQRYLPAVQDCPTGYQLSGSTCTITPEYKANNPKAAPNTNPVIGPGNYYPNPYPNPYYPAVPSCPQGQYYQYNGGGGSCKSAPGSDPNTSPTGGTPPPGYQPQPMNCPSGWTYSSTSYGGFGGCVQSGQGTSGGSGTSGTYSTPPTYTTPSGSYSPAPSSCPSGQYWNGSSCVSSGGSSGGYTTPAYPTPSTYTTPPSTYTTPPSSYTTPPSSYTTPPYSTPEYPTPAYTTPPYTTPPYPTP